MNFLGPEGYLQWVEIDLSSLIGDIEAGPERAKFTELFEPFYAFLRRFGLSQHMHETVYEACSGAGFLNINSHACCIAHHPNLKTVWPQLQLETFSSMMPCVFEKTQEVSKPTVVEMTSGWIHEFERLLGKPCMLGGTFHCDLPKALVELRILFCREDFCNFGCQIVDCLVWKL